MHGHNADGVFNYAPCPGESVVEIFFFTSDSDEHKAL